MFWASTSPNALYLNQVTLVYMSRLLFYMSKMDWTTLVYVIGAPLFSVIRHNIWCSSNNLVRKEISFLQAQGEA